MFPANPLSRLLPAWPLRLVALGCVMMVGLLSLAAVSPEIHAALHHQDQGACEHEGHREHSGNQVATGHICAVTLFNQGMECGFAPVLVLDVPELLITEMIALADQVARAARAAQLPPGCGPPVC